MREKWTILLKKTFSHLSRELTQLSFTQWAELYIIDREQIELIKLNTISSRTRRQFVGNAYSRKAPQAQQGKEC